MPLLLALLACAGPLTPEAFEAEYVDAVCAYDESCSENGLSYQECVDLTLAAVAGRWTTDGCPNWDPEAAQACITTYLESADACGVPDATLCTRMSCQ